MPQSLLFATNNPGKLAEVRGFADKHGIKVYGPAELGLDLDVLEDGDTFADNARKKVEAYLEAANDPHLVVAADDSGISIEALGGEPGVRTKRWAGYEMTDQEIRDYCLERMKHLQRQDRVAHFITVIAYGKMNEPIQIAEGRLSGVLLEEPVEAGRVEGFPFRSLFYLPEHRKMLYEINAIPLSERRGLLTHREQAILEVIQALAE